jgi:hypothetical protein
MMRGLIDVLREGGGVSSGRAAGRPRNGREDAVDKVEGCGRGRLDDGREHC